MAELPESDVTFAIIGAAMQIHRELGPGFLESIYQRAMEVELQRREIGFQSQVRMQVTYRGTVLGDHILDLVVGNAVVVELKAVKDLAEQHVAQILSYLKVSKCAVGLLINFSKPSLEHRRIVLSPEGNPRNPFNPRNPW